jgi:tetratricopeptide (TPR) repeat protein
MERQPFLEVCQEYALKNIHESQLIQEVSQLMEDNGWRVLDIHSPRDGGFDATFVRDEFIVVLSAKAPEASVQASWIFRLADIVDGIEDTQRPSRGARGILITAMNVSERLTAAAARYPIKICQYRPSETTVRVAQQIIDLCNSLSEQSPNRSTERRSAEVSSINISGSGVISGIAATGGNAAAVGSWPSSTSDRIEQEILNQTRVLGPYHPSVLSLRARMAEINQSVDLFRAVLADQIQHLGSSNPDTINTMINLAAAYQNQGRYSEAAETYKDALDLSNQIEDNDNIALLTLRIKDGLAGVYVSIGDISRGIPLYEQVLADRLRMLGESHPDTLTSRNNLAFAYQWAGNLDRAIPLYEQTLADSIRVLGEEHPSTLTSRNNLATTYRAAGDLGRAIPLYEEVLADRARVLGESHPDTLTSRNNLASAYAETGDLGRAIPLYEQTLADSIRVLGEEHPLTKAARRGFDRARHQ